MVKAISESESKPKKEVKSKKVKSSSVAEQSVETPEVETPALETSVVETSVVETPVVETLVVETQVVETQVVEQSVDEQQLETQEESNTEILFNKLINQFQDIQLVMKTLHSNLKVLQKEINKEKKEYKKKESKHKKKSNKKRSPSGFAKPSLISNELANFLNLPDGSELARTDVTSKVIAYIKEHNLQNPENKKEIILDDKLNNLLIPQDDTPITFFNIQTHLKKHFIHVPVLVTVEQTDPIVV